MRALGAASDCPWCFCLYNYVGCGLRKTASRATDAPADHRKRW